MRTTAKKFIRMEVHSRQSVRFWTDLWHPLGRLIEVVGEIGVGEKYSDVEFLQAPGRTPASGSPLGNAPDPTLATILSSR